MYYGQHVKNQTLNQQVLTELMLKVYKTDSAKLYKISCATPHVTLTPIGKGEVQININLLRIHSIEPQKSQTVFAIGPKEAAEPVLKVTSPLEMRSLEDTLIKGYYCAGIMAREFGNIHHFCEEDKQDLFKLLDFHPSFVAINFIKDIPFADLDYNYNDYHKVLDNKKNWKKVKRRVKKITDQERGFACDGY